jgi:hypothetical protein
MIPEVVLFSALQPFPGTIFAFRDILTGAADLFGGIVLFIIGILVIALVVAAAIVLLPAIVVAVLIWFLTGSFFYAGIAFLVVALLSIVAISDD